MLRFFQGSWVSRMVFWICLLGVITLSLLPLEHLPTEAGVVWDKAQHALGFAALTALGLLAYPRHTGRVVIGLVVVGVFIESTQQITGWRQGDLRDLVANGVGIAMVLLTIRFVAQLQKVHIPG